MYAVYSAVLAAPRLSHTDDNSKYLIAALAGAIRRFNDPAECIRVRPGYEAKFNQALSDFAKHKADQFRLERAFSISKPYELLDEDAIQQFYQSRMVRNTESPDGRFVGATDLIRLDNVYFDDSRTLALVYASAWCGTLCAMETWRVFEKQGDKWEEKQWVGCMTVS